MAETGPVLIGGPHRSGTGMLRALLGANSALAMPPTEYHFFASASLFGPGSSVSRQEQLQHLLGRPKMRAWGLAGADLASHPLETEKDLYTAPLAAYAKKLRKPRFGEKTPLLERHFSTLHGFFGTSLRFVHILRDPFDTWLSAERYERFSEPPHPVRFARTWRMSLLTGLHYSKALPRNYLLLRYEDFVADPPRWTDTLCIFCGLPQEPYPMLDALGPEQRRNSSFANEQERTTQMLSPEIEQIIAAETKVAIADSCRKW